MRSAEVVRKRYITHNIEESKNGEPERFKLLWRTAEERIVIERYENGAVVLRIFDDISQVFVRNLAAEDQQVLKGWL